MFYRLLPFLALVLALWSTKNVYREYPFVAVEKLSALILSGLFLAAFCVVVVLNPLASLHYLAALIMGSFTRALFRVAYGYLKTFRAVANDEQPFDFIDEHDGLRFIVCALMAVLGALGTWDSFWQAYNI